MRPAFSALVLRGEGLQSERIWVSPEGETTIHTMRDTRAEIQMRTLLSAMIAFVLVNTMTDSASAGYILRIQDVSAPAGSIGTFVVTLTNTGSLAATLSSYQIQLTTDLAGLSFTDVERAPVDYVFPSALGSISSDFPGPPLTRFTALDLSINPSGFDTLASGRTFGVLLVHYAVDPLASAGVGHIRFVSPGPGDADLTQLADGSFNLLEFQAVDGNAQITPSAVVPEPSSLALLLSAVLTALGRRGAWGRARHDRAA